MFRNPEDVTRMLHKGMITTKICLPTTFLTKKIRLSAFRNINVRHDRFLFPIGKQRIRAA
ncbi:hypothetical protein MSKU3_3061 [Komagataeibacter oboediens]|nr:hypothetical protein MSKU3_3061 [Komagataeibacter oboediens]